MSFAAHDFPAEPFDFEAPIVPGPALEAQVLADQGDCEPSTVAAWVADNTFECDRCSVRFHTDCCDTLDDPDYMICQGCCGSVTWRTQMRRSARLLCEAA